MQRITRIIGIDPGLRRTGWGVLDIVNTSLRFVAAGTVRTHQKSNLAFRLRELHDGLHDVFSAYAPHEAAVEATFVNCDASATLKLGQARGIAMLVPALCDLPVFEYAPNKIKKSVIGAGHGNKKQIMIMLKIFLPESVFEGEDSADALAIAVCHAHHRQTLQLQSLA